jgi:hypothetical protein
MPNRQKSYPRNSSLRPLGLSDVKDPTCLDNRFIDGGKVVSPTNQTHLPIARGLRHELSSPAPTLGSWVGIPLRHGCLCMFCVRIISELKLLIKSLI